MHAALVMSWVALASSFIGVFVFNVPELIVSGKGINGPTLLFLFSLPIGAGVFAFIGTLFGCWSYNWVAKRWGGIKIVLS